MKLLNRRLPSLKPTTINTFTCAKLSTGVTGAWGEMLVCTDLLSRGYEVFRSVSPACSCDLVAQKDGKLYRVEVKTGFLMKNGDLGAVNVAESKLGLFDVLAVVIRQDGSVHYHPDITELIVP